MPNDNVIVDEIRAGLERDPDIPHPQEVAVSARDGTVTLRGTVGSPLQRLAAARVAKSAGGVRAVEDEISVDLRDRSADDEIRGTALQRLMSNAGVPDERIEVAVADGWLTLKGEVKQQTESNAAFETVSQVPGVGGITNEIRVVTAGIDG